MTPKEEQEEQRKLVYNIRNVESSSTISTGTSLSQCSSEQFILTGDALLLQSCIVLLIINIHVNEQVRLH